MLLLNFSVESVENWEKQQKVAILLLLGHSKQEFTQEAVAQSRHDWKIVDWDVKPQHNKQNKTGVFSALSWKSKDV